MKTSYFAKASGAGLGLLFSTLISSSAMAGPGPQFWQSVGKAKAPVAEPAKAAVVPTHACAGSAVVAVTEMKPALPNGRGPLVAVQTGTKTVCHMCPVATVATTNDWPSHRGPLVTTEVTKTGVEHTCTNCVALAMQ